MLVYRCVQYIKSERFRFSVSDLPIYSVDQFRMQSKIEESYRIPFRGDKDRR